MNTQKLLSALLASSTLLAAGTLSADEIRCKNGTIIVGEITSIDGGLITVKNPVEDGGESKVKQSEVLSVATDKAVNVRTSDGKTHTGTFSPTAVEGEIMIGGTPIPVSVITSSWLLDGKSPEERDAEKYNYTSEYEVGASLTGTTGNSESFSGGLHAQAVFKNVENALKLYANYNYGKTKDNTTKDWTKSTDNLHVGADWSSEFYEPWFWYARTDAGFDRVQNIRFFDTSAAGFGVKVINKDDWHLSLRGGLAYRYEAYKDYTGNFTDRDDTNTVGLDFGLSHDYNWSWGKLVTEVTYVPGFDNFTGDYYIFHETYLQVAVEELDQMYLRVGVKNEYRSRTTADEHLDTTYYAQLVFYWK